MFFMPFEFEFQSHEANAYTIEFDDITQVAARK